MQGYGTFDSYEGCRGLYPATSRLQSVTSPILIITNETIRSESRTESTIVIIIIMLIYGRKSADRTEHGNDVTFLASQDAIEVMFVSDWVIVCIDFTDVTLVSDDTYGDED